MRAADTLSVCVPFRIRKHGGRKLMLAPDGTAEPTRPRVDSTLVKALARAFRWKRMLESGEFATIILPITAVLPLAGLAQVCLAQGDRAQALSHVEAILDRKHGPEVTLARVLEPFPVEWAEQVKHFGDGRESGLS